MSVVTARSTGVFLAFRDLSKTQQPFAAVIQIRSHTNQENKPQSLPGAFQPTAAKKAESLEGLSLPVNGSFPPLSAQDRKLIIDAVQKECGDSVRELVEQVIGEENRRAAENATLPNLSILLDYVNEKGRWVRNVVVVIPPQSDPMKFLSTFIKPIEVGEFSLVTAQDVPRIRTVLPEEKTPIQSGGTGVPKGDIAGFADDCDALRAVFMRS